MASFLKRGKVWQYTVNRYEDGKRKPVVKSGFATKKEAQLAALGVESQLNKGHHVVSKDKSLAEYFEEWIDLYKSNRHRSTYDRYRNSLDRVREYFKDTPIQKITRADYQRFLNTYGVGRARETVRKLNTQIRSCIADAIEDGYITADFTRKAELNATEPAKKSEDKHLSYEDSAKLYKELFKRLDGDILEYHLILLGLISGARYGELIALTGDSFDFENNLLKIKQSWDYKRGTGFGPLKNKNSERTILIDGDVMKVFKNLVEMSNRNNRGLVFYRPTSIKVIGNKVANKVLKLLLKEIDIGHITMHGLRHTHASVLLFKGVNIHSVSKRLGHADVQTTLDHYAHVLEEMEVRDEEIAINIYK